MKVHYVIERLQAISSLRDFQERASELTAEWARSEHACDAVEPILRFMEQNPILDFGNPGPLVHFVERFFGRGYETKLLESIRRRPIYHTVWMLNRVINGTTATESRQQLIAEMEGVLIHPASDNTVRDRAARFLDRLRQDAPWREF